MTNPDALLEMILELIEDANLSKTQKRATWLALKKAKIERAYEGPAFDPTIKYEWEGLRCDTRHAITSKLSRQLIKPYFDRQGRQEGFHWGPLVEAWAWSKYESR